jgi:ADP-ribosyltransferase exoenzyme
MKKKKKVYVDPKTGRYYFEEQRDYSAELAQQKARQEEESNTRNTFKQHFNNYSPEDKHTLHNWTKDTTLYKHEDGSNEHAAKALDQAISKHTLPHTTTLWSKTKNDPRNHLDQNNIVNHPRFMSTSIHKNIATDYLKDRNEVDHTNHVLKITAHKGTPAAYIHDEDSINPKYKEVVLPRNKRLKYSHTDTTTNNNRTEHIHHMELM